MALTDKIAEEYNALKQHADRAGDTFMHLTRDEAFQAFTQLGLPSMRHEEWRYTPVKRQLLDTLSLLHTPSTTSPAFHSFEQLKSHRLVFINGRFSPQLSSIYEQQGVDILSMTEAFRTRKAVIETHYSKLVQFNEEHFAALNTAFASDGAFIHVAKNTPVKLPIVLVYVTDNTGEQFTQTRNLIVLETGASALVVEDFQNTGSSAFVNHVSEIFADQTASLNLMQLQTETQRTTAVCTTEVSLQRDARFTCTCVSLEGVFIRNNINARMKAENAEAHLYGLYYATEKSLIDNHLLVDHIAPQCQSNQLYKGILDDESTGVFNGKVFVKPDAQKTNAFQSSKVLLLSENASINSKPQLEIFADDVKCSHGAAIGQLNKNELFYFMARGIAPEQAKALLTYAFANEVLDKIGLDELKNYVQEKLKSRLHISF